MLALEHRLLVMRQFILCARSGFSQNIATERTAHAMSGGVIVAVHKSAPTASRYGNVKICFFSSWVCGSFGLERVGTPEDTGILLAFFAPNLSIIDFT